MAGVENTSANTIPLDDEEDFDFTQGHTKFMVVDLFDEPINTGSVNAARLQSAFFDQFECCLFVLHLWHTDGNHCAHFYVDKRSVDAQDSLGRYGEFVRGFILGQLAEY